ncbi:YceD family protein [Marinithermus hydrothermalis]|uniref:DUF177 domain-containing protein n=1 Tax=Marinithermus hydrothermalis (strain DSM 14884 / JCM 11576 / T1) TaxID=869210 RepID=F2NP06_MARHT|nr:DUF177 domain-containing protein [Marinithermus hydrothermalis]AEB11594.1 protein of unknown function DUF177 [Marinithermus hydrothermalis DSM 14884]
MDYSEVQSINLAKLLHEPGTQSANGVIRDRIEVGEEQFELENDATWSVTVTHTGNEFFLSGELHGTVRLECRRCLTPTPYAINAYFQHLLQYDPEVETLTLIQNAEDEDVYLFSDPNLDLSAFLAEAFVLELPYTVLCQEDCRGLCPVCGANRNETDCGHTEGQGLRNPFSALGKLLDEV